MNLEEAYKISEKISITKNQNQLRLVLTPIMKKLNRWDRLTFHWWMAFAKACTGNWREVPGWFYLGVLWGLFKPRWERDW
jgi:hypothetical protein